MIPWENRKRVRPSGGGRYWIESSPLSETASKCRGPSCAVVWCRGWGGGAQWEVCHDAAMGLRGSGGKREGGLKEVRGIEYTHTYIYIIYIYILGGALCSGGEWNRHACVFVTHNSEHCKSRRVESTEWGCWQRRQSTERDGRKRQGGCLPGDLYRGLHVHGMRLACAWHAHLYRGLHVHGMCMCMAC